MERIASYTFAFPTRYLRLGAQQLHIFERTVDAPAYHHVGIDVDDFVGVYERAKELAILDGAAFFSPMYELPDGSVQMYLRDPGSNLIEIDWPDVSSLDRSRIPELKRLEDDVPQTSEGRAATLYLDRIPQ